MAKEEQTPDSGAIDAKKQTRCLKEIDPSKTKSELFVKNH